MTTRSHFKALHERAAGHHVAKAKYHAAMHRHFSALAECFQKTDESAANSYREIADRHTDMMAEHTSQAEFHVACAKDLASAAKAAGLDGDDDAIIADGVSLVYKSDNLRAVPRNGAPNLVDTADVDERFASLVKVEDGID